MLPLAVNECQSNVRKQVLRELAQGVDRDSSRLSNATAAACLVRLAAASLANNSKMVVISPNLSMMT